MRLLLITDEARCGGAELAFFMLACELASRAEVHVALSAAGLGNATLRRWADALAGAGGRVHVAPAPLHAGTVANLHPRLRRAAAAGAVRIAAEVRPDLALVNLPTVERGQAVLDGVRLGAPEVPAWGFVHLSQPPSAIGARLGALRDPLVPGLLRRFDRLLTVSKSGAREVVQRYGLSLPDVIYPPTEPLAPLPAGADRTRLRAEHGLPDGFLLGLVGRVQIRHKGHDAALRVLASLRATGRAPHLVVIGDGPDLRMVGELAGRLGVEDGVTQLGWRQDVDALVPLLDALIMPSHFEGLPQTAVQAATAGVAVVGYGVDGLGELLPPGFAVGHGDEAGLARAVAALMDGALRWPHAELAARARAWCEPAVAAARLIELAAAARGRTAASGAPRRAG